MTDKRQECTILVQPPKPYSATKKKLKKAFTLDFYNLSFRMDLYDEKGHKHYEFRSQI